MSLFSIGLSGLYAGQIALSSTGNNITNVNTPGYNREITKFAESGASGGVVVSSVERQFNQFITSQFNRSNSATQALTAYQNQITQIDSLLADSESGLPVMMQNFFASLSDLAGSPSDSAARQGLIGTADNLTAQFRSMSEYFGEMQEGVNSEVRNQVMQINNLSDNIAQLNKEISLTKAKTGDVPNALLNQRDQLVADLSTLVEVRLTIQDNDVYNVSLAGGMALVAGTNSFDLEAVASDSDPTRVSVAYRDGGNNLIPIKDSSIQGGELGGALRFREEALDTAENRLGQLALALAMSFNEQHNAGLDLNGDPGQDFFSFDNPKVYSNERNTSAAVVEGVFSDVGAVTTANYEISYDAATGYSVKNLSTKSVEATFPVGTTSFDVGGMTFSVTGTPNTGDKFMVKPFENMAGSIENVIRDVSEIAAASPVGDTGTGDNRNAQALYQLQFATTIEGSTNLNQGYASLVNDVANKSQIVAINQSAQSSLSDQLRAVQQSDSGVNLDEEAANLLKYQQYYQASARIIETASTVMDTVLGLKS